SHPLMSAVMMLVLARRTSMTMTETPASSIAPAAWAVRATSMRTRSAPVIAQRADLQAQGVQVDEALGIALAIDGVRLERGKVGPVKRARRPPARHRGVALVQRESHRPGHVLGNLVHQPLQRAALRREPEAVIDHLGVARDQRVAQMQDLTVERDRLQGPPG